MRKTISVVLALLVCLLSVSLVSAATSLPGGPYASAINVQNMGTVTANVVVQYVGTTGESALTTNHTIQADDVLFIYVPNQAGLTAGTYSVVISSDQPVAAVANFSDNDSAAAYSGLSTGATTWYIPGVYDNYYGYSSEVVVQNVTASVQTVTLQVFAPGSSTPVYTTTQDAPSAASVSFNLAGLAQLDNNVAYSAKVTAPGNVVAISNYWGSLTTAPQLYSFDAFSEGATSFYMPSVLKNYYGWNSSLNIQNISTSQANVTVTFSNGYSKSYTVPSNSAALMYVPNETALPNGIYGVKVVSDQPVAVLTNQSNSYNRAGTYNGFSTGSKSVALPNVMKQYYNYSSSVTCQNIGAGDTQMTISYAGAPGATKTSPVIHANESWNVYLPNESLLPVGLNSSASVVSSAENIVCIVSSNMEHAPYNTQNRDELRMYNGTNR